LYYYFGAEHPKNGFHNNIIYFSKKKSRIILNFLFVFDKIVGDDVICYEAQIFERNI